MIFFEIIRDVTLYPNKADLRKKVKYNAKEPNAVWIVACMQRPKCSSKYKGFLF